MLVFHLGEFGELGLSTSSINPLLGCTSGVRSLCAYNVYQLPFYVVLLYDH